VFVWCVCVWVCVGVCVCVWVCVWVCVGVFRWVCVCVCVCGVCVFACVRFNKNDGFAVSNTNMMEQFLSNAGEFRSVVLVVMRPKMYDGQATSW